LKIDKVKKSSSTTTRKIKETTPVTSFHDVLAVSEENQERHHLDDLLDDIKEQGRALSEKRDVALLVAYQDMVKDFIEEAVNFGLKVSERRGHGRTGRSKVMRMVSMVDEKLIELTEKLLMEEQSSLKLLSKVGAIEGLLLNLYA
jgi:hypothetical protein